MPTRERHLSRKQSLDLLDLKRPELLRGVPVTTVLHGHAAHFQSSEADETVFELSQPTTYIDFFISHSWRASRPLKYLAILQAQNQRAAITASTAVAMLMFALQAVHGPLLLGECPTEAFGQRVEQCIVPAAPLGGATHLATLTFIVVFFKWHRRANAAHVPLMFLDKLCIRQTGADKIAGIMSIGGFLARSERMMILWSNDCPSRESTVDLCLSGSDVCFTFHLHLVSHPWRRFRASVVRVRDGGLRALQRHGEDRLPRPLHVALRAERPCSHWACREDHTHIVAGGCRRL
jgi:hypothetical protein